MWFEINYVAHNTKRITLITFIYKQLRSEYNYFNLNTVKHQFLLLIALQVMGRCKSDCLQHFENIA